MAVPFRSSCRNPTVSNCALLYHAMTMLFHLQHNEGVILKYNGDVYVGQLCGNQPDGFGALIERAGSDVYEGTFIGGHREGRGVQAYRTRGVRTAVDDATVSTYVYRAKPKVAYAHRFMPMEPRGGYLAEGDWCGGTLSVGAVTQIKQTAAMETMLARRLQEGQAQKGSYMEAAATIHREWMQMKRQLTSAKVKPSVESELNARVSQAVNEALASVTGVRPQGDDASAAATTTITGGVGGSTAATNGSVAAAKSFADEMRSALRSAAGLSGFEGVRGGAPGPLKDGPSAEQHAVAGIAMNAYKALKFNERGDVIIDRSEELYHYTHGVSPLSHVMMSAVGAGAHLPHADRPNTLHHQTQKGYVDEIKCVLLLSS